MRKRFAFRTFSGGDWQLNLWWVQINHYSTIQFKSAVGRIPRHTHIFCAWRPHKGYRLPL